MTELNKRERAALADLAECEQQNYQRPIKSNRTLAALEARGLIVALKLPHAYYYHVLTEAGRAALAQ